MVPSSEPKLVSIPGLQLLQSLRFARSASNPIFAHKKLFSHNAAEAACYACDKPIFLGQGHVLGARVTQLERMEIFEELLSRAKGASIRGAESDARFKNE